MNILIINPNSDEAMTAEIQKSALTYAAGRFGVDTVATPGAPQFIDYYQDAALAAPGMIRLVEEGQRNYDAFVVACHCDPNLDLLKELSHKPVVGIGEASMKLASMLGHSFSVLSTDPHSAPNKEALIWKYHLTPCLASVRTPEPEDDRSDPVSLYETIGRRAVLQDGAEVLVLGCAGLSGLERPLSDRLGVPVLDGVVCGLIVASGLVQAGLSVSKIRRYARKA